MFKLKKHTSYGWDFQVVFDNAQIFDTFFIRSNMPQDMHIMFTDDAGFNVFVTIGGWRGQKSAKGAVLKYLVGSAKCKIFHKSIGKSFPGKSTFFHKNLTVSFPQAAEYSQLTNFQLFEVIYPL